MKFIFENNRTQLEERITVHALKNNWVVSEVFDDNNLASGYFDESTRLKWAPVLTALAFGEGTAFYGFGKRIAEAEDISAKSWLSIHLLDEAKHTEGFSRLLDYFYPSYKGRHETLLKSKDVYVFYGHTDKCDTLLQWLLCTQIAEVFGKCCYNAIRHSLSKDPIARQFFTNILSDEARHIAYIYALINSRAQLLSQNEWQNHIQPFLDKMIPLARNMFEARKKGDNFKSFEAMEIDVTQFCNHAELELRNKYFYRN